MSKTLSSILHIGAPVSGTGSAILSDSPVITSKIDTSSTSFDLVNTSATTVNIAGAATALALAGTTGTTTIRNNLTVSGNITYGGGANQLSATNLSVDDALIYLAANNSVADIIDIGIVGRYNDGVNDDTHSGLVRDATDKVWKLFSGITAEPTTVVDFTGATYDNLKIGGLTASTGTFTGQITSSIADGTAPFVVTSTTPVANLNIGGYSSALKSASTVVSVSAATAPTTGQVLTATSSTTASWQTPTAGGSTINLASQVAGTLPVANGGTGSTSLTFPSGTAKIGYLNIPQVSQSSNYECVLSDSGKHILHPSADTTGRTFTIPANASVAYPIGTVLMFVNEPNAGNVAIQVTTDTLYLAGAGTTGIRTLTAPGIATAIKTSSTTWIISGTGLS